MNAKLKHEIRYFVNFYINRHLINVFLKFTTSMKNERKKSHSKQIAFKDSTKTKKKQQKLIQTKKT